MSTEEIGPAADGKVRRLSAGARRAVILDAALDVFAGQGLAGARLREIAARAGITEAYLFRHFNSKGELYEAAVVDPLLRLVERFETRMRAIPDGPTITGADLVLSVNRHMLEFMIDAVPYIGASLFSDLEDGRSFYSSHIYPRVHDPVRTLVAAIDGWPGAGVDIDVVANSMWGLCYGVALDARLAGLTVNLDKTTERLTRLYTLGIPSLRGTR